MEMKRLRIRIIDSLTPERTFYSNSSGTDEYQLQAGTLPIQRLVLCREKRPLRVPGRWSRPPFKGEIRLKIPTSRTQHQLIDRQRYIAQVQPDVQG